MAIDENRMRQILREERQAEREREERERKDKERDDQIAELRQKLDAKDKHKDGDEEGGDDHEFE